MPMNCPIKPTVMPLKVRMPNDAMVYTPTTLPRIFGGARSCTMVCVMAPHDNSKNPAANNSAIASA